MQSRSAIVIFGGGLKKDETTGRWRTTNFDEGDRFGVMGDRLRVVAGALLAREHGDWTVIALGGKGQLAGVPGAPAVSDVIKQELIELGVAVDRIVTEGESGSTYQQLVALQKTAEQGEFAELVLVSSRYNVPRLGAMIEHAPGLELLRSILKAGKMTLCAAEDVALEREPEVWREIIERAYASEMMRQRIQLEEKGVQEIKAGTYRYH